MARFAVSDRISRISKSEAQRLLQTGHYRLSGNRTLVRLSHPEIVAQNASKPRYSYIPETLPSAEIPGLHFQAPKSAGEPLGGRIRPVILATRIVGHVQLSPADIAHNLASDTA